MTRVPEKNRELKQVVCNKSTDDGMMLKFYKLKNNEYEFINSKTNWLPPIPKGADSIDISYFRDDFLGDFHLIIEMVLPFGQELDSIEFTNWIKINGGYRHEKYED